MEPFQSTYRNTYLLLFLLIPSPINTQVFNPIMGSCIKTSTYPCTVCDSMTHKWLWILIKKASMPPPSNVSSICVCVCVNGVAPLQRFQIFDRIVVFALYEIIRSFYIFCPKEKKNMWGAVQNAKSDLYVRPTFV